MDPKNARSPSPQPASGSDGDNSDDKKKKMVIVFSFRQVVRLLGYTLGRFGLRERAGFIRATLRFLELTKEKGGFDLAFQLQVVAVKTFRKGGKSLRRTRNDGGGAMGRSLEDDGDGVEVEYAVKVSNQEEADRARALAMGVASDAGAANSFSTMLEDDGDLSLAPQSVSASVPPQVKEEEEEAVGGSTGSGTSPGAQELPLPIWALGAIGGGGFVVLLAVVLGIVVHKRRKLPRGGRGIVGGGGGERVQELREMTTSSDGEGAGGAGFGAEADTFAGGSNSYHKNPLGTETPGRSSNRGFESDGASRWTEHLDTNSGAKYFANAATGETSWERPSAMGNAEDGGPIQPSASPSASGARPVSLKLSPMGESRKF